MKSLDCRAWHIENKKMFMIFGSAWPPLVDEYSIAITDTRIISGKDVIKHTCQWVRANQFIIMQSTGLKDKKGVEIFDGDIIHLDVEQAEMIGADRLNCLVGFKNGCFMFGRSMIPDYLNSMLWLSAFYEDQLGRCSYKAVATCKVIGNLYENPELLK